MIRKIFGERCEISKLSIYMYNINVFVCLFLFVSAILELYLVYTSGGSVFMSFLKSAIAISVIFVFLRVNYKFLWDKYKES
ncbi:MAG: hypothetical protein ACK5LV_02135 [Lachnospirales bacterium]